MGILNEKKIVYSCGMYCIHASDGQHAHVVNIASWIGIELNLKTGVRHYEPST